MTSVSEDSRRVASSSDLSPRRLLLLWFESKPLGCNLSRSVSACLNLFTNDESTSEAVEVASDLIGRGGGGAGWLFLRLSWCFWGVWDWWPLLVWFWNESSELALKKKDIVLFELSNLHPWTLVVYQGLIYLLKEVKLAASLQAPGDFLITNFWHLVTWVLFFNFCFHGLLRSQ